MNSIKKALSSHALKKMICHLIKTRRLYCKFRNNQCTFKNNLCTKVILDLFIKHFQKEICYFKIRRYYILHPIKTKQIVQIRLIKILKICKKYKVNANK